MSPRVLVFFALVAVLDLAQGRTVVLRENDVKPVGPEGVPKVYVGADGVSASFGGYSASAGLGGQVGGSPGAAGGLFARAGTPDGTGASAGLGGSLNQGGQAEGGLYAGAGVGGGAGTGVVAGAGTEAGADSSAGASSGTPPNYHVIGNKIKPGPTFYNDIFNIPTSILGAVNRLLNGGVNAVANIGSSQGHAVSAGGEVGYAKPAGGEVGYGKPAGGAHVQVGASAGTGTTVVKTSQGLLNDIFNIPITALNAVNQLLNNNPKTGK